MGQCKCDVREFGCICFYLVSVLCDLLFPLTTSQE